MWLDVYEEANELTKEEQFELFNALKNDLFPDEPDKITKLLKSIRESRFSSGIAVFIVEVPLLSVTVSTRLANCLPDNYFMLQLEINGY